MQIEIISIGNELVQGAVNTNAAFIAEALYSIGLTVDRIVDVPDKPEQLKNQFSESFKKSNIVITTGGLGPTFDDITRVTISKVLGRKLVFSRKIMESIARHFVDRNIEMPKENECQAYLLEGARPIPNKIGTAPGMLLEHSSKLVVIMLPGPPHEMKPMFKNTVIPFLRERYEREFIKQSVIQTAGVPESTLATRIDDIVHRRRPRGEAEVDFGLLARPGIVTVRIAVHSKSELLAEETLRRVRKELYDRLDEDIFGEGACTLEEAAGSLLIQKRKTVSVAESCTGGLVANRLTNVPGSSLYFKQGIVAYSNEVKMKILGVDGASLKKFGAVSREVAREMADGCKRIGAVDFALGITGIAGPGGGSPKKPVGLVYIAVATPEETTVQEKRFIGQRLQIKEQAANCAIDMLRRSL